MGTRQSVEVWLNQKYVGQVESNSEGMILATEMKLLAESCMKVVSNDASESESDGDIMEDGGDESETDERSMPRSGRSSPEALLDFRVSDDFDISAEDRKKSIEVDLKDFQEDELISLSCGPGEAGGGYKCSGKVSPRLTKSLNKENVKCSADSSPAIITVDRGKMPVDSRAVIITSSGVQIPKFNLDFLAKADTALSQTQTSRVSQTSCSSLAGEGSPCWMASPRTPRSLARMYELEQRFLGLVQRPSTPSPRAPPTPTQEEPSEAERIRDTRKHGGDVRPQSLGSVDSKAKFAQNVAINKSSSKSEFPSKHPQSSISKYRSISDNDTLCKGALPLPQDTRDAEIDEDADEQEIQTVPVPFVCQLVPSFGSLALCAIEKRRQEGSHCHRNATDSKSAGHRGSEIHDTVQRVRDYWLVSDRSVSDLDEGVQGWQWGLGTSKSACVFDKLDSSACSQQGLSCSVKLFSSLQSGQVKQTDQKIEEAGRCCERPSSYKQTLHEAGSEAAAETLSPRTCFELQPPPSQSLVDIQGPRTMSGWRHHPDDDKADGLLKYQKNSGSQAMSTGREAWVESSGGLPLEPQSCTRGNSEGWPTDQVLREQAGQRDGASSKNGIDQTSRNERPHLAAPCTDLHPAIQLNDGAMHRKSRFTLSNSPAVSARSSDALRENLRTKSQTTTLPNPLCQIPQDAEKLTARQCRPLTLSNIVTGRLHDDGLLPESAPTTGQPSLMTASVPFDLSSGDVNDAEERKAEACKPVPESEGFYNGDTDKDWANCIHPRSIEERKEAQRLKLLQREVERQCRHADFMSRAKAPSHPDSSIHLDFAYHAQSSALSLPCNLVQGGLASRRFTNASEHSEQGIVAFDSGMSEQANTVNRASAADKARLKHLEQLLATLTVEKQSLEDQCNAAMMKIAGCQGHVQELEQMLKSARESEQHARLECIQLKLEVHRQRQERASVSALYAAAMEATCVAAGQLRSWLKRMLLHDSASGELDIGLETLDWLLQQAAHGSWLDADSGRHAPSLDLLGLDANEEQAGENNESEEEEDGLGEWAEQNDKGTQKSRASRRLQNTKGCIISTSPIEKTFSAFDADSLFAEAGLKTAGSKPVWQRSHCSPRRDILKNGNKGQDGRKLLSSADEAMSEKSRWTWEAQIKSGVEESKNDFMKAKERLCKKNEVDTRMLGKVECDGGVASDVCREHPLETMLQLERSEHAAQLRRLQEELHELRLAAARMGDELQRVVRQKQEAENRAESSTELAAQAQQALAHFGFVLGLLHSCESLDQGLAAHLGLDCLDENCDGSSMDSVSKRKQVSYPLVRQCRQIGTGASESGTVDAENALVRQNGSKRGHIGFDDVVEKLESLLRRVELLQTGEYAPALKPRKGALAFSNPGCGRPRATNLVNLCLTREITGLLLQQLDAVLRELVRTEKESRENSGHDSSACPQLTMMKTAELDTADAKAVDPGDETRRLHTSGTIGGGGGIRDERRAGMTAPLRSGALRTSRDPAASLSPAAQNSQPTHPSFDSSPQVRLGSPGRVQALARACLSPVSGHASSGCPPSLTASSGHHLLNVKTPSNALRAAAAAAAVAASSKIKDSAWGHDAGVGRAQVRESRDGRDPVLEPKGGASAGNLTSVAACSTQDVENDLSRKNQNISSPPHSTKVRQNYHASPAGVPQGLRVASNVGTAEGTPSCAAPGDTRCEANPGEVAMSSLGRLSLFPDVQESWSEMDAPSLKAADGATAVLVPTGSPLHRFSATAACTDAGPCYGEIKNTNQESGVPHKEKNCASEKLAVEAQECHRVRSGPSAVVKAGQQVQGTDATVGPA